MLSDTSIRLFAERLQNMKIRLQGNHTHPIQISESDNQPNDITQNNLQQNIKQPIIISLEDDNFINDICSQNNHQQVNNNDCYSVASGDSAERQQRVERIIRLKNCRPITQKQRNALYSFKLNTISDPFAQAVEREKQKISGGMNFYGQFLVLMPDIQIKNYDEQKHKGNVLPPLCIINNLLTLSPKLSSPQLKIQIKRMSVKFRLPFNRILITFGIEKLIQIFYEQHDISLDVHDQYLYQKIGQYLYHLFKVVIIQNWFVLRRIIRGVLKRFGADKIYNDHWLEALLKKRKYIYQMAGVNVFGLLAGKNNYAKNTGFIDYNKFIKEEQPQQIDPFVDYRTVYPDLQLEDESLPERIHDPEEPRAKNKLKYYIKKAEQKEEELNLLRQEAMVLTGKNDNSIINFTREPMLLVFEILIPKAPLPSDMSLILSKRHKNKNPNSESRIKRLGRHFDLCSETGSSEDEEQNRIYKEDEEIQVVKKNQFQRKKERIIEKRRQKQLRRERQRFEINRTNKNKNIEIQSSESWKKPRQIDIGQSQESSIQCIDKKDEKSRTDEASTTKRPNFLLPNIHGILEQQQRINSQHISRHKDHLEEVLYQTQKQIRELHLNRKFEGLQSQQIIEEINKITANRNIPKSLVEQIATRWVEQLTQ